MNWLLWLMFGSVTLVLLLLVLLILKELRKDESRTSNGKRPTETQHHMYPIVESRQTTLPSGQEVCFFPGKKVCDCLLAKIMPDRTDLRRSCDQRSNEYWHSKTRESIKNSLLMYYEILSNAKICVDLCMFRVNHRRLSDTLLYVKRKGVKVRIITDLESDDGDQLPNLISAGIDVKENRYSPDLNKDSQPKMHNKFLVVDRKIVIMGSFNWTHSAEQKNYESIFISEDVQISQSFVKIFESMWNDTSKFVNRCKPASEGLNQQPEAITLSVQ